MLRSIYELQELGRSRVKEALREVEHDILARSLAANRPAGSGHGKWGIRRVRSTVRWQGVLYKITDELRSLFCALLLRLAVGGSPSTAKSRGKGWKSVAAGQEAKEVSDARNLCSGGRQ
jgi:hypothetical protein